MKFISPNRMLAWREMWLEINLWKIGLRVLTGERTGEAFSSSPHFEDVIKLL